MDGMGFVWIMLYTCTVQHMSIKIWIKHKLMNEIMFIVLFINKKTLIKMWIFSAF